VNAGLIFATLDHLGLLAAPIALLASEVVLVIYLGSRVLKVYSIRVRQMFFWNKLMAIGLAVLLNVPILLIGESVPIGDAFERSLARDRRERAGGGRSIPRSRARS
jgi:hypothetical protein